MKVMIFKNDIVLNPFLIGIAPCKSARSRLGQKPITTGCFIMIDKKFELIAQARKQHISYDR